ncbi:MAG: hypothetical protein RID59_08865 [Hoeflea sp.]
MAGIQPQPNLSIELSVIDSIARGELKGLAIDAAELTLDVIVSDELVSAIPVIGSISKLYKAGISIRDRIFVKKIASFLGQLADIDQTSRERFATQLASDEGSRTKAGAALILLLDHLDDLEKPEIIGRLYRKRLEGQISFNELRRFCMIVERSFLPDLHTLANIPDGEQVEGDFARLLYALGLVAITGEDYGTFDGIGGHTWYEVSDLGRRFISAAFR